MRFVYFSDLHAHPFTECSEILETGINSRLQDCLNVLIEILEYARKNRIKQVWFGGDLVHARKAIPSEVVPLLLEVFSRYEDLDMFFYPGNHDYSLAVPSKHCLSALKKIGTVVDRRSLIEAHGVRFSVHPFKSAGLKFLESNLRHMRGVDVVLLHQGVQGVVSRSGHVLMGDVISRRSLPRETLTLSGHIHEYQKLKGREFYYAGSPSQQDWGDSGIPKFFLDVDLDKDPGVTAVPTLTPPKFVQLKIGQHISPDAIRNNFVRVVVASDEDMRLARKMSKGLMDAGARYVAPPALAETAAVVGTPLKTGAALKPSALFKTYVKNNKSRLNSERLVSYALEVLREVSESRSA